LWKQEDNVCRCLSGDGCSCKDRVPSEENWGLIADRALRDAKRDIAKSNPLMNGLIEPERSYMLHKKESLMKDDVGSDDEEDNSDDDEEEDDDDNPDLEVHQIGIISIRYLIYF
jgi:hypothetical protein